MSRHRKTIILGERTFRMDLITQSTQRMIIHKQPRESGFKGAKSNTYTVDCQGLEFLKLNLSAIQL